LQKPARLATIYDTSVTAGLSWSRHSHQPDYRSASHLRQCVANVVLASASVGAKPCDGTRGMTTPPVIVHIHGRSGGALLLRKIRPIARSPLITS
jgi:hypothetical protein